MARGREVKIYVTGDAKDAARAFKQTEIAAGGLGKLGGGFTRMGALGTAAFAGLAVAAGAFAFKGVQAASDLGEATSATNAQFGKLGSTVTDAADEMNEKFGISKKVFLESATSLGAIAQASGLTGKAAADMSVDFTKLAADLSSFKNIPMEEALAAIRSGLVGEAEPLRRHGVLLNEAAVAAEAHRLGLTKSAGATGELSEEQQKQAAQAERVNDAERGLRDALESSEQAQEDLTEARRDARRELEDLALAVRGDAISEERARMRLYEAKKKLREADVGEEREAALDVKQAELDLIETRRRQQDNIEELSEAKKKGVDGSEKVIAARKNERDAEERVIDSQKKLDDATQSTSGALTEAAKVQARMSLIMKGLGTAQGDLARTADSPANAFRKLQGQMQNVMVAVGQALMPAIQALMPVLTALAPVIGDALAVAAKELAPILIEIAKALGPLLIPIVKALAPIIGQVARGFLRVLKALMPLIPDIVELMIALMPLIDPITRLTVLLVELTVAAIGPLVRILAPLVKILSTGLGWALDVVTAALEPVLKAFRGIRGAIKGVVTWLQKMADKFSGLKDKLPEWMIPGSPTPLETGLRGIASGFREASREAGRLNVPEPTSLAAAVPSRALVGAGVGAAGGTTVNVTVNGFVGTDKQQAARVIHKALLEAKHQAGRDLGLS